MSGTKKNSSISGFFGIPPRQFSLFSSLLGIVASCRLDTARQNSLGNFLVGVGQALMTAAAQTQLQEDSNKKDDDYIAAQVKVMKEQIDTLEAQTKKYYRNTD